MYIKTVLYKQRPMPWNTINLCKLCAVTYNNTYKLCAVTYNTTSLIKKILLGVYIMSHLLPYTICEFYAKSLLVAGNFALHAGGFCTKLCSLASGPHRSAD